MNKLERDHICMITFRPRGRGSECRPTVKGYWTGEIDGGDGEYTIAVLDGTDSHIYLFEDEIVRVRGPGEIGAIAAIANFLDEIGAIAELADFLAAFQVWAANASNADQELDRLVEAARCLGAKLAAGEDEEEDEGGEAGGAAASTAAVTAGPELMVTGSCVFDSGKVMYGLKSSEGGGYWITAADADPILVEAATIEDAFAVALKRRADKSKKARPAGG